MYKQTNKHTNLQIHMQKEEIKKLFYLIIFFEFVCWEDKKREKLR